MLLACRKCEKAGAERKYSAPRGDFASAIGHIFTQFQRAVNFEYQAALSDRENQFHEILESLRSENRELRLRLNLPMKDAHYHGFSESPQVSFPYQERPTPMSRWQHEKDEMARTSPHHGGRANLLLPISLRNAASDQERSAEARPADHPNKASLTPTEESSPKRDAEPEESDPVCMDTNASVMVTVGNQSDIANYLKFELWSVWTQEHKSYADKITDRCSHKTSRYAVAPQVLTSRKNPYAISPSSSFFMCWSMLFLFILSYELIMFPMFAFSIPDYASMRIIEVGCVCFWTMDLILSLFVGYYDSTGELVMKNSRIVVHYARTWLIPDAITVTVDWLLNSGLKSEFLDAVGFLRAGKALRCVRILRLLRMLRMRKVFVAVHHVDVVVNSPYFAILKSLFQNMLGVIASSHFIGCVWYLIGNEQHPPYPSWVRHYGYDKVDWEYSYLTSLHWSLTQFTPGSMNIQPQNSLERAYAVLVLVCGMVIFSSIVSSINVATNSLKNMNARYDQQLSTLRRYFREQQISRSLLSRVLRYAEIIIKPKQRCVAHNEVDMLKMLPQSLYMDVMLELYDQHLTVHPFFRALCNKSKSVMQMLCCTALQEIILSNGDELFGPGQIAHAMFFVIQGQLTYTVEHLDISEQVSAKQWFCEAVLWTPWVHQGTMCANMESELLALDSAKFREVLSKFHADMWVPKKYGAEFVERMNELAGFFTDDPSDDVNLSDMLCISSAITLLSDLGLEGQS